MNKTRKALTRTQNYKIVKNKIVHGDDTLSEDVLDDIKSEYVSSQQEIIQPLQQGLVDNQENAETATDVQQEHFTVEDISEEEIAPTKSTSDIEKHFFDAQQEQNHQTRLRLIIYRLIIYKKHLI